MKRDSNKFCKDTDHPCQRMQLCMEDWLGGRSDVQRDRQGTVTEPRESRKAERRYHSLVRDGGGGSVGDLRSTEYGVQYYDLFSMVWPRGQEMTVGPAAVRRGLNDSSRYRINQEGYRNHDKNKRTPSVLQHRRVCENGASGERDDPTGPQRELHPPAPSIIR
jgi:hypothetical protein